MTDLQLKNLENNQELAVIEKHAPELTEYAQLLVIKTDDDNKDALNMLANVKDQLKQTETMRRFFVDPYNALVKKINDYFRPITEALSQADVTIRRKMTAYNNEVAAKAEKARLATLKKVEAGTITIEQGVKKLENVKEAEKNVRSAEATMSFRIVKKVEIVDASLLPREYLVPDEVKIRKVAVAGINIPGVKVTEEKVPSLRNNF